MRIATYNIENLFFRHVRFIKANGDDKEALSGELDDLMIRPAKKPGDYERMRELWELLYPQRQGTRENRTDREWEWLEFINQSGLAYKAELGRELLTTNFGNTEVLLGIQKVKNKARVIRDVDPDILILQEVESQTSLDIFIKLFLENVYPIRIFVPALDRFGRGMAVLCKQEYSVLEVKSFTNPSTAANIVNYAAQLYRITSKYGNYFDIANIQVFDSGLYKRKDAFGKKTIGEIVNWLKMQLYGTAFRMIAGSLNVFPHSNFLSPFFETLNMTKSNDLECFITEQDYGDGKNYHALGTYAKGVNLLQKDYMLVGGQLAKLVIDSGMNRKGILPPKQNQWLTYKNLSKYNSTSGSPLLWITLKP